MKKSICYSLALPTVLAAQTSLAGEFEFDANVQWENRVFANDAALAGQDSSKWQTALAGQAELRWFNDNGDQRVSLIQYGRADNTDSERDLYDIKEAYWAINFSDYELLIGLNTVFWGVTESVHLVDIVNQTDAVSDIDGEDKLGQPMVKLDIQKDWGLLSLYALPYFRERTFTGEEGRLRTPIVVDTEDPIYESHAEQQHIDFAIRYSHYIGDVDIGLSAFSGTSREPRLIPTEQGVLQPHYDQISQLGLDVQYTSGAWLWKLESFLRDGVAENYVAAVAGFEFTQYQVFDSNMDLGYLLEYQYDDRSIEEPQSIADNDIFAGARLSFNDVQDTAILAGIVYDHKSGEQFFNVEAERRLGQSFSLSGRLRVINNADVDDILYSVKQDDYLQISLEKYF